jgi:hypothetical protein
MILIKTHHFTVYNLALSGFYTFLLIILGKLGTSDFRYSVFSILFITFMDGFRMIFLNFKLT